MPSSTILPNSYALLLLPNKTSKLIRVTPNSTISLGKFGSFLTNSLIHRPYHLTFDVIDEPGKSGLIVVPTEQITRDLLGEQEAEARQEEEAEDGAEELVLDDAGLDDARNNRETVDDPNTQKLSWAEIEELKKQASGSGKEIITAIMTSHANLHQKTAYALSKYTLRKRSKYLKRFTVIPVDVWSLLDYLTSEKDVSKIMELQQEGLGLMLSLGNVRYCPDIPVKYVDSTGAVKEEVRRGGRWLVVDETGGLLVAAVAERLGLLQYEPNYLQGDDAPDGSDNEDEEDPAQPIAPISEDEPPHKRAKLSHEIASCNSTKPSWSARRKHPPPAIANTITLVHPNEQPNLSLLKYFQYDTNNPPPSHPLHTHLRTISYLSLLCPSSDPGLATPERVPDAVFKAWKSGKKSAYLKKWRRWERSARTVMETRAGGFDGLLVASWMDIKGLLAHLAPFVRGSGQVIVWRPEREALVLVIDACGKELKGDWLRRKDSGDIPVPPTNPPEIKDRETEILPNLPKSTTTSSYYLSSAEANPQTDLTKLLTPTLLPDLIDTTEDGTPLPKELDPTILLAPTIHSISVRKYQVLPGRTHPVMTSRGGAEGYVFAATRVLPIEGKVEAMGKGTLRRRAAEKKRQKEGEKAGKGEGEVRSSGAEE